MTAREAGFGGPIDRQCRKSYRSKVGYQAGVDPVPGWHQHRNGTCAVQAGYARQPASQLIEHRLAWPMRAELLLFLVLGRMISVRPAMDGDRGMRRLVKPDDKLPIGLGRNDGQSDRNREFTGEVEQPIERRRRIHGVIVAQPELCLAARPLPARQLFHQGLPDRIGCHETGIFLKKFGQTRRRATEGTFFEDETPGFRGHDGSFVVAGQKPFNGGSERRHIARRGEKPGLAIPHDLRHAGNVLSHHRKAGGLCFKIGNAIGLAVTRPDVDSPAVEDIRHGGWLDRAKPFDTVGGQAGELRFDLVTGRPVPDDRHGPGQVADRTERLRQHAIAFELCRPGASWRR